MFYQSGNCLAKNTEKIYPINIKTIKRAVILKAHSLIMGFFLNIWISCQIQHLWNKKFSENKKYWQGFKQGYDRSITPLII